MAVFEHMPVINFELSLFNLGVLGLDWTKIEKVFLDDEFDLGELLTSFKGTLGVVGCFRSFSEALFKLFISEFEELFVEVSRAEFFGVSLDEDDFFKVVFVWDFCSFGFFK